MKTINSVLKGKNNNTPIWFLRQAGRYMPEYMQIRSNIKSFLDLCFDEKKAKIVTMQPISRYDLDAAIIFSDILVLPFVLGWDVHFKEKEGPILKKFETEKDLEIINNNFDPVVENVYKAISDVRADLSSEKSLIGFVGSPWTVASYMIEGRGKHDFSYSRIFIQNNRKISLKLIDILVDNTIIHLSNQIKAGADSVMLFDSWAGVLFGKDFYDFVISPTSRIVKEIKKNFNHVPIIGFPRNAGYNYERYIEETGIDIIHADQFIPLEILKKWQSKIVVQGNLDPIALLGDRNILAQKVDDIFNFVDKKNFIFNIGHGIMPLTNPETIEFLVKYVRDKY